MSEVIDTPTETAAPAETESLLTPSAPAAADPAPAADPAADAFTFADKVLVKDGEAVNWEQTARKAEQARQHLEKRLGAGDAPPKDVTGYEFKVPEDLKDFELKAERVDGFKAEALKQGITPAQFAWMMDSYLKAVPDLMEGAAKMTASQARGELQNVWKQPAEFDAGLKNAQTAMSSLPKDLQEAAAEFGTNPTVIRLMSWMGAQMREDTPPSANAPLGTVGDVQSLQMSEAYRNPRHPDHAKVSEQVRQFFNKQQGADMPI